VNVIIIKNIRSIPGRRNEMSRKLRIWYPGATYHITARGNKRSPLFFDETDLSHVFTHPRGCPLDLPLCFTLLLLDDQTHPFPIRNYPPCSIHYEDSSFTLCRLSELADEYRWPYLSRKV
jgi:hypothetical protein